MFRRFVIAGRAGFAATPVIVAPTSAGRCGHPGGRMDRVIGPPRSGSRR